MKSRKIALWAGGGLLVLLAATLAFVFTADLGVFKPQIERWVSGSVGRAFSISGPLSIEVGSQSVIIAEDVRFADADWTGDEEMLTVGYIELRVDTGSLLEGPLRLDLVRIANIDLRLLRSESGKANWKLEDGPTPANTERTGLDVLAREIIVEDLHLVYSSPERAGPVELQIDSFEQTHGQDDFLTFDVQGSIGGRELGAQGKAGTWSALLAQEGVEFELEARLDTLVLTSQGIIDDLDDPRRPALSFSAAAPDVNDLARLLQLPASGAGTIDLKGSLSPLLDGPLVLDVDGNVGQAEIEAQGSFSDLQNLDEIDLELRGSAPDLARVLRLAGIHRVREAPFTIDLDLQRRGPLVIVDSGHMVFADARFDLRARLPSFPSAENGHVQLEVAGSDLSRLRDVLQLPGRGEGAYSLAFDLSESPDGVDTATLDITSELLRGTIRGRLGQAPEYFGTELSFDLSTDDVADIGSAYGVDTLPDRAIAVAGAATYLAEGVQTRGPIKIHSGEIEASIDGLITLRPGLEQSQFALTLQGPDLSALISEFVVVDGVPAEPYDFSGRMRVAEAGYRLQGIAGTIGSAALEVDGLLGAGETLAGTQLEFRSSGPALEHLVADLAGFQIKPGAYTIAGRVALSEQAVNLNGIRLSRERGDAALELALAVPLSKRQAAFDVRAQGDDVHSIIGAPFGFEAHEAPFSIRARGEFRENRLTIDELDIEVGDATLAAKGDLDFETTGPSTALGFQLVVPALDRLGTLHGRQLRAQGLFIEATVEGSADLLKTDDMNVRIGESDVRASVRLERTETPHLVVSASSGSVVLAPFTEMTEPADHPVPERADGRLIPDIPLPLEWLHEFDASFNVSIEELRREQLRLSNVRLVSQLRDGALNLQRFSFETLSGSLQMRGTLQPVGQAADLELEIVARDIAVGGAGVADNGFDKGNLDLHLATTGAGVRELASNARGVVYVDIRDARATEIRFLRRLFGDVLNETLAAINPFSKSDAVTRLDCIVAPLQIVEGRLVTRPDILVVTDKILVQAIAEVDLATEGLAAQVRTSPRKGLTVSAGEILNPYVRIVGTLAAPRLAVDEKGMLISGGAAVATGGLSVLAKAAWDRMSRSGDPCDAAARQAVTSLGEQFPVFSDAVAE